MTSRTVPAAPSRWAQLRTTLTREDRAAIGGMAGFVVLLHVVGFGVLIAVVVPAHYDLGSTGTYGIGVGVLAYTLGMRHAFDADHIAAIDNTTRKLIADGGRRPLSVGFWFSLGHSTVVFGLTFLLAFGVKALVGEVENGGSRLHSIGGTIGATVSGTFLWILGILNLVVLIGIIRIFRRMRAGEYDEQELEEQLNKRGFMNRFLSGLTRSIAKPWHIYPVGVLFGLGFDTATEVGLLVLAGGAAAFSLPFYAILVLPILFAAGMSLLDSLDGVFMNFAYSWAFARPVRKVFYNITITALSIAVALVIGTIELVSVITQQAGIDSGPLAAVASIPLNDAGYGIVALFALAWLVAFAIWRLGHVEQRWSATPGEPGAATGTGGEAPETVA